MEEEVKLTLKKVISDHRVAIGQLTKKIIDLILYLKQYSICDSPKYKKMQQQPASNTLESTKPPRYKNTCPCEYNKNNTEKIKINENNTICQSCIQNHLQAYLNLQREACIERIKKRNWCVQRLEVLKKEQEDFYNVSLFS